MTKRLLLTCHCPSENTASLRDAAGKGVADLQLETLDLTIKAPLEVCANDVIQCDGIIIGTTENFGNMAGLTKDFFERIYYPCLDVKQGLPMALYVRAGEDGRGTRAAIEKIITGLRWKPIANTLILRGDYQVTFTAQVRELAMTLAAGVDAEIF